MLRTPKGCSNCGCLYYCVEPGETGCPKCGEDEIIEEEAVSDLLTEDE